MNPPHAIAPVPARTRERFPLSPTTGVLAQCLRDAFVPDPLGALRRAAPLDGSLMP